MKNVFCPISDERINEQVTRLNALLTILTVITAFALNSTFLLVFLVSDFYIRAFTKLKHSPISYASSSISQLFNLPLKQIDKAPKIFAARMGFVMSTVIAVLFILKLSIASIIIAGILAFFAGLEFAFAICVGCTIYNYFVLPFYNN